MSEASSPKGVDECVCGQGEGTYLVIPAANAELATQAVGAGAVIHACAVLGREVGSAHPPELASAPQLPVLPAPQLLSFL